jgi:hypothetical protein
MPNTQFPNEAVLNQPYSESAATQQFVIHCDGSVEVPWISPSASCLVMAVWESISNQPFPVTVVSGKLYCG